MIVTFCGHGDFEYNKDVRSVLRNIIEDLINKGANEFLLGGYGTFDLIAAHTIKALKFKYPHILSVYVTPYINREWDRKLYDCSEYPPIENTPKRYAILKRNKWMIDNSDILVAYVSHSWGGAAKTLEYAHRKNIEIMNIAEQHKSVAEIKNS